MHIEKGSLLVASPNIQSGLYTQSVVLLCEHNEKGSFGLLLNKPIEIALPKEIIDIENSSNPHLSTWAGGPLQVSQMMLLHTSSSIPDQVLQITSELFLGGDLEFLQTAAQDPQGPLIRVCFGYCGWEEKQLEKEHLLGYWTVHKNQGKVLFTMDPHDLWSFLCNKHIQKINPPEDLSLN